MRKFKTIIKILFSLFCIFFGMSYMLLFSFYDDKIYNIPRAIEGVMDFEDCKNYNKKINMPIVGELEFYYNRWIITDHDENEMDSFLYAPSKWSNQLNNSFIYPKKGYASYKVTLINLEPNTKIKIPCTSLTLSVNLYLNHEYAGYCGFPSKTEVDRVKDLTESNSYFVIVPEDGKVELVLETGLSEYGGLVAMPYIMLEEHNHSYMNFINFVPGITLGLLVFSIFISLFISFSLKRGEGRYYPFFVFLCITAHFIFSYDILLRTRGFNWYAKDMIFQGFSFLTLCIFAGFQMIYMQKIKSLKVSKLYFYMNLSLLVVLSLINFIFLATIGSFICWLIFYILQIPILIKSIRHIVKQDNNIFFNYVYFIMLGLSIIEMMDYVDLISLTTYGHTSFYMIFIMIMTLGFYAHRLIFLNKMEKKSKDIEIEALKLKQDILINQIKPHFVYNALATIQSLYHKDVHQGDYGIILFSKYLRTNVDSIDTGMIDFSDELDNVINYVELVNLSLEQKFNLELEIEVEDFKLPILSLQPIIENALKYSKVNEKPDGYIRITTKKLEKYIIISVSNNGSSFDVSCIHNSSKGLKNVKARLKEALDAEFLITSNEEKTEAVIQFEVKQD
ncbi:MAG: histidine kinase [Anaeroplasmataceae bacterium]|nr:histidine kinase [Anaeroplasmataceae bacterium]